MNIDFTKKIITNPSGVTVLGDYLCQDNKTVWWIKFKTDGTYGYVTFVTFKDDPDLYIIKVQKINPGMNNYLHHEVFMLEYLKSMHQNKYPIMGIEEGFKSTVEEYNIGSKTYNGIVFHPNNLNQSLNFNLPYNCLISKAASRNVKTIKQLRNIDTLRQMNFVTLNSKAFKYVS